MRLRGGDQTVTTNSEAVTRSIAPTRDIRKPASVLIIGSGPIVIGQAAEFDYAGTQACKAMREEGVRSILVNSNPATIMTDAEVADAVYIEPLTVPVLERIIARERPEGLLPTLGGQTGLNLARELAGVRLALADVVTTQDLKDQLEHITEMLEKLSEQQDSRLNQQRGA